jgi:hypothetical protein
MGSFEWFVAKGGYHCEVRLWQDLGAEHPTPTQVLFPDYTLAWRRYPPMVEHPVLYRIFADVEPTAAGIQGFANQYGLLGVWGTVWPDDAKTVMAVHGEPVAQWQASIHALRDALLVWDVLQRRDHETLGRWAPVEVKDDVPYVRMSPEAPMARGWPFVQERHRPDGMLALALRDPKSYVVEPLPPEDAWGWAFAWLQAQINWHLTAYVTPHLGYDPETDTAVPFAMQLMPKHLYGALWLQFALSVGGKEWDRHCLQCGTWFRVPAKARRPNTAYCSTRCRVRAARQRQTDAAATTGRPLSSGG